MGPSFAVPLVTESLVYHTSSPPLPPTPFCFVLFFFFKEKFSSEISLTKQKKKKKTKSTVADGTIFFLWITSATHIDVREMFYFCLYLIFFAPV